MSAPTTPGARASAEDTAVVNAMASYLRVCRSGGMPDEMSKTVEAAVEDAARLGYFADALAPTAPVVPDELRALSEAAFPGPWHENGEDICGSDQPEPPWDGGDIICDMPSEGKDSRRHWPANRAFIVAAVNYVRAMLAATPSGRAGNPSASMAREPVDFAELDRLAMSANPFGSACDPTPEVGK